MTAMPMKQVHQGAGQQQQVGPGTRDMVPVLAQQEEGGDQSQHQQSDSPWTGSAASGGVDRSTALRFVRSVVHAHSFLEVRWCAVKAKPERQPSSRGNVKRFRAVLHPDPARPCAPRSAAQWPRLLRDVDEGWPWDHLACQGRAGKFDLDASRAMCRRARSTTAAITCACRPCSHPPRTLPSPFIATWVY